MGQDQPQQQARQHDPDQESPYFTADEVAKFLRVTKQTALRWLKSGVIPGGFQLTEGGVWRINWETFLAWLKEREQDAYQQRLALPTEPIKSAKQPKPPQPAKPTKPEPQAKKDKKD